MVEERRVRFAVNLLKGRLHRAVGGKRCGCGACAHWVAMAARRAGIPREQLEAALAPAAAAQKRPSRRLQPMRVKISESSTFRVRGREVTGHEGLAMLLTRFHDPG